MMVMAMMKKPMLAWRGGEGRGGEGRGGEGGKGNILSGYVLILESSPPGLPVR